MTESGFAKKSKEMKKEIKTETVLFQFSYTSIVVLSVLILSMAFAGIVSADNKALEATVLPLTSEEKGLISSELNEKNKSRFAEPDLWVGTGEDILDPAIPKISAEDIAEFYAPMLYRKLLCKCPDRVYYRVIKGKDSYVGFDAYLIQYFAFWVYQPFPEHIFDYEPIFIWVRNIGEKPYRVAYDRCDTGKHHHEIHRTYSCIYPEDGWYPILSLTNDKAYYPYGKTFYSNPYLGKLHLLTLSNSLKNNWDGNHVKLGIATAWHTFDTDLVGKVECPVYELSSLTDAVLITAYREQLTEEGNVEAFKYDISDPFKGVFWEDHYHRDSEFPTISGDITSAVVNNEILTVEVSMLYDNTGAGGSPGKHLTGLWVDRFDAKISTDTGDEDIGDPYEFDEQSPGEYILKYDVSGIDINSVLHLKVWDNVNYRHCTLSKDITFVSAEVYVPDDYPTIQAAVDAVNAGDTIIVRDGTYTENVDVDKSLTIKSENGAETTIVQAVDPNDHVFEVTADDVTISGFTVKGATEDLNAGIYLSGADNCIISDNKVSNKGYGIWLYDSSDNTLTSNTASNNSHGIHLWHSSGNSLTDNTANSNSAGGIWLYDSSGNTLMSNTANSNTWNGISLDDSSGNTLTSNTANSNNHDGINVYSSSGNTLRSNTASNNYAGICLSHSSGNSLTDNTANWNSWNGIHLWLSRGNSLTSNTASNNDVGIELDESSDNRLTSNTANSNFLWAGIWLDDSSNNNELTGNTANSNNDYGIFVYSSSGNTLRSNTASNNERYGIYLYDSSDNKLTSNTANSNSWDGIHLWLSSGNSLTSNTANSNSAGSIGLYDSSGNTLMSNTANSNFHGIGVSNSSSNTLTSNTVNSNTEDGISLFGSSDNTLTSNTVSNNEYGIHLDSSGNNKIYINNFISNTNNVHPDGSNIWNSPSELTYTYKGGRYRNYLGNYWDDYTGIDADGDGIGDTPYPINSDNDNYPLREQFENYEIEYGPFEFYLCSPADLFITDPKGLHVGLDPNTGQVVNEIPGAVYTGPGSEPQIISIPGRKIGDYLVTVVPHPDASPTDTFTLEVRAENTTLVLAKDVPISDIPSQSYRIKSTSTGMSAVRTEIAIEKTVFLTGTCPGSDPLTVHTGDNVTYCYTITNKGDLTLANVTVTDDLYGLVTLGTTTLAPGASTSGTLMHVVTESDIPSVINIATANGTNPYGVTVSDTDACTINVEIHPALNVIKTASPTEGEPGTAITFTINMANTGDCTLNPVKVVDMLPAGLNYISSYPTASTHDGSVIWNNVGPFAVGASKTLTLVAQIGNDAPALLNNTVTVTGTPPVGGNVTASDTALVIVTRLELEKSGSPATVAPGGTVTYTIKYSNPGGKDLTNVVITEHYPEGVTFISADPAPDAGTNNKWTLGTLSAGAFGQIIIKVKVPESIDLSFTESGSVTGEGFVMVSKDISTEQKPYSLKNVVTLSCAELAPVSAFAITTVSGVPGTSLEITEHGSGLYSSDEILNLQTKNKSIMLQKSTEAEYQPTSFNFSDGFAVNFASRWMQDICARNIIMGDAMHKKIKDASYIKDETIAEVGGYRTSMEFESSFYGAAHIGTVSKSAKTSEDYIGAFEITWAGREECRYLFNWSRVPGNDSEKLIQFLVDVLDLDWAENATITKSADEMSINITDNGNTATITIDENKKTATVKVGGETIYVLEVRIEDDTLNIYDCKLEQMEESVTGIGYVMLDKDLASGQIQVREHGSGNYSSDMNFESGRLDKVTEAEYQPTTFNFSDGFDVNFSSKWVQGICAKNEKAGTAIHKKISDASSMVDDTTATKSSMEFKTSFNGSMHIGARTEGTRISEDYIGVFNITELIKIGKPAISTPSTPTPDWLPCPFPEPAVSTPPSDLESPSSDP